MVSLLQKINEKAVPDLILQARECLKDVLDPEVPALSVLDLGIIYAIDYAVDQDGLIIEITPTYSGCPAINIIEECVISALKANGINATVKRVLSPAWSSDLISDEGRAKLLAYGIVPPIKPIHSPKALFGEQKLGCPLCASSQTHQISEFGSTACKALYQCDSCHEVFEYFKCV